MPRGELENFIETSIIHPRNGSVHPFLPFLAVNSIRITRARISRPSLPPLFVLHFLRDFLQFGLRAISERFVIFASVGRRDTVNSIARICLDSSSRRFVKRFPRLAVPRFPHFAREWKFIRQEAFNRNYQVLFARYSFILFILVMVVARVNLTGWCIFVSKNK